MNTGLLVVREPREGSEPIMTLLLSDAGDPRGPKAVQIAAAAGQWLKCRRPDGSKCYGIRSSRDSSLVYLVTRTSCTCYDFVERHHDCKHVLACRLHCALVAEQQAARKPAVWTRPQRGVIPTAQIERES